MAHWVSAQGQVKLANNAKTSLHYDVISRKPQTQNNFFFNLK